MTYPPEIKAKAVALFIQGYSRPRIQAILLNDFGETPSETQLTTWKQEALISAPEEDAQSMSNWREIIKRAQRHTIEVLDSNTFDKSDLPKLVVAAGVGTDKVHAEKQLQRGPDIHQHLHLLIQQAERDIRAGNEPLLEPPTIDVTPDAAPESSDAESDDAIDIGSGFAATPATSAKQDAAGHDEVRKPSGRGRR